MGKSRVHHEHDVGYKYIFSHKETFLELLRGFVKKEWVNLIKSEDLILVDKSYILEDFSEEESDVVYRVNIEGEEIIFYILLEFQSRVDYRMPVRLLFYMVGYGERYLKMLQRMTGVEKILSFPPLFPWCFTMVKIHGLPVKISKMC